MRPRPSNYTTLLYRKEHTNQGVTLPAAVTSSWRSPPINDINDRKAQRRPIVGLEGVLRHKRARAKNASDRQNMKPSRQCSRRPRGKKRPCGMFELAPFSSSPSYPVGVLCAMNTLQQKEEINSLRKTNNDWMLFPMRPETKKTEIQHTQKRTKI